MLKEKLKTNNKINANAVGGHGDPVCPHFEENSKRISKTHSNLISNLQSLNSKAGITLIALIITIIVMLILVGVTISVALNGGLFEKANTAVKKTQKEVEREELTEIAIGAYDANTLGIDEKNLNIDTNKYTDLGKEGNKKVVEGKKSKQKWEINLKTAEVKEYQIPETYSFTLGNFMENATGFGDGIADVPENVFWSLTENNLSDEFKKNLTSFPGDGEDGEMFMFGDVSASFPEDSPNSSITLKNIASDGFTENCYGLVYVPVGVDDVEESVFRIRVEIDGNSIADDDEATWLPYKDLVFTITQ